MTIQILGTSKELAMQLYIQKVRQLDSSFQLEQKSAEKLGNEQTRFVMPIIAAFFDD